MRTLYVIYLVLIILCTLGCTTPRDDAATFQSAAVKIASRVYVEFDAWDNRRQEQILAEAPVGDKERVLGLYISETQKPARLALGVLREALNALSNALAASDAGAAADWSKLVGAVIKAAGDLAVAFRRLGVPINVPKLAGALPQGDGPWLAAPAAAGHVVAALSSGRLWPASAVFLIPEVLP